MADPEVARAISDAARIVHAGNRRSSIELADLVQIGWERVITYLGRENVSPPLAFVCARQGMLAAIRLAAGRDQCGRQRRFADPIFVAIDEARDVAVWDQWRRYALPLEEMLDAKRALLGMPLREAVAWYNRHWLGFEHAKLEDEFGVSAGRIRQYADAANHQLRATVDVPRVAEKRQRYAASRARYGAAA